MQQNVHLLTSSGVGLPTDIWVPSTDSIPPQYSKQLALSANKNLLDGLLELSIETYYKSMNDLITLKPGAEIIGFDDWKNKVDTNGIGRSYGAEIFFQKKKGKQPVGWVILFLLVKESLKELILENGILINLTEDMIFL